MKGLYLYIVLVLNLLLIRWISPTLSHSRFRVRELPGYPGYLPFELETGYIGVGKSEDVQRFYYFVKSDNNPQKDPLVLWLPGGQSCSVLTNFLTQIGPLKFVISDYDGSLPKLVLNPYSWTKAANILFVDLPVGAGFSYSKTADYIVGDTQTCWQTYEFLKKWLIDHPEFLSNPVYIGGISYCGFTVPVVVQHISDANKAGIEPFINLKGYLLGNGGENLTKESNSRVQYAHGMGLIPDELYKSIKSSCAGEYTNVDPRNVKCQEDVKYFSKCIAGINYNHILEPKCTVVTQANNFTSYRRYLDDNVTGFVSLQLNVQPLFPDIGCRSYAYALSYYWANDKGVRRALHIREGTVPEWQKCNPAVNYTQEILSTSPYHSNLSKSGYRSLIFNGDHDLHVTFTSAQNWIRSLNYTIVDDWRPWSVNTEIGGYTRTFANNMTFATVKGAGHTTAEYKPKECYAMFKRWISEEPL